MVEVQERVVVKEGAPRLRLVKLRGRNLGEAMSKVVGTPAGTAELNWVLDPANYGQVRQMFREGTHYFFPGAAYGIWLPTAFKVKGAHKIAKDSYHRDGKVESGDRVVVID